MDGVKCAHEQCTCFVDLGETYCHYSCREAAEQDAAAAPHGRCRCGHIDCASR